MPSDAVVPVAASGIFSLAWLLIVLPGGVALLLQVIGKASDAWGHLLATLAPIASFVLAVVIFVTMLGLPEAQRSQDVHLYDWFVSGRWNIGVGLQVDQLSILFALLITGVGSLIHIYSIGYMAHDPRRRRFFAYLNLFVAAILLLVLADNYLVVYVGWEGVGLASYLLIGFWQDRPVAATAGTKAFIVNRVGDMGMSLAVMLMLASFGSSSFVAVNAGMPAMGAGLSTVLGLMLLFGACAKSAQVPLQSWLLDAMEGPTPVSALIHAATMVTAGVYLVVRSHAVFAQSEAASTAVVVVGTVTLLFGAWIGCAKDDIKRVLAGSTMSQIGYMMLAAGIGPAGYALAIFHLLTHGFFKANMFLGAGSVMHGTNDEVNMRRYGGLRRAMPITFLTFGSGYLAIIGFPFFAGYYSKGHIIDAAFEHNVVVGVLALIGSGVTAFYMTRLMLMTFFGTSRWAPEVHPHESGPVMTVPLILLGLASIFGGLVLNNWIGGFLDPAVAGHSEVSGLLVVSPIEIATLTVVAVGVAIAITAFGPRRRIPTTAPAGSAITVAGRRDLYGDAFNEAVFMRPGQKITAGLSRVDAGGVDGFVRGLADGVATSSQRLRHWQSGFVRSYALTMVVGVALVGFVLVLGRLA